MQPDPVRALLKVARVLDALAVEYAVVGSLASSYHGVPRSTNDVDVVALLRMGHVTPLVAALAEEFHVDELAIRQAVADRRSFNVLDSETFDKIDVFVLPEGSWRLRQVRRRERIELASEQHAGVVYVSSSEDTVLAKLEWYEKGGRVSERQWMDVIGVLRVQFAGLDMDYLQVSAAEIGLADLLQEAIDAADLP